MQSSIHSDKGSVRIAERAQPLLGQRAPEIQPYDILAQYPIALDARAASIEALNQILADTIMLRDLYKRHHWQVAGHSFDLLVSGVIRSHEMQVWFLAEHLVDTPLVRAE
jgi:starvation-inducible DNA-binding protein